ncbi:MAG TPA: hypothetical protein VGD14_09715, partial [bacterium]
MSKNCIFISLLLIVVFHFENSIAGDGYWTKIGPDDRTYKAMAIDSQNPNVFYTGSFYKSRDGGKTWQNLGDHFLGGSKFLVVHPKDSTLIYGGCVFQKIKRSNDGGKTFKSVSSGLPDNTFYDLIPGKLA